MPRRTIPTLSLLGSLILLPACGSPATPASGERSPRSSGPQLEPTVEIVPLTHADATETADVVNELIAAASGERAPMRVVADARINALVVYGDEIERRHIRDLLAELDQPLRE